MIAHGNQSVYGVQLGVLMLQARFPRILGDMGNAMTWPFPVRYKVVRGASPDKVVRGGAQGLLPVFIEAAQELVEDGCTGITTNCGFLSLFQQELAAALDVPVATSSLMQATQIQAMLPPGKRVGILSINASSLTQRHLDAAGVPEGTLLMGTESGKEFTRAILNDEAQLDISAARQDMLDASLSFQKQHPELGALLFECTNMIPYAADVQAATGLPVYSIYNLVQWFQQSLAPQPFIQCPMRLVGNPHNFQHNS